MRRGELDWKKILRRSGSLLESNADRLMRARRLARARTLELEIIAYRGFGTPGLVMAGGRVLARKTLLRASDRESVWQNLLASYQRLASAEVPGARLTASFHGTSVELTTDEEGYFHLSLALDPPLESTTLWHPVSFDLIEPIPPGAKVTATGAILIPPVDARYGVISDLDDTVIQTGATSRIQMLRTTLLQSARTRRSFEGVAAFYQALHSGKNPIFYVSSSPWNLYDVLTEFLSIQGFPDGPLFLGDFGFDEHKWLHLSHDEHKHQQIQRVFETYPDLPFVLIGDSGQKDPEIYLDVVRTDPGRVLAVYIRDVTTPARDAEVQEIARRVSELGVEMALVTDTSEAEKHARLRDLI